MPIRNCPIYPPPVIALWHKPAGPALNLKLFNPHTKKDWKTFGFIDTGADECTMPASIAQELGHNLKRGDKIPFDSCAGEGFAYRHTTDIHIYHPITKKIVHTIRGGYVDYAEDLKFALIGRNNFLNMFVLCIDYPKEIFSLTLPPKK